MKVSHGFYALVKSIQKKEEKKGKKYNTQTITEYIMRELK